MPNKANPINTFLQHLLPTNAATTDGLADGGAAKNAKKAAAAITTTTTTTTTPTAAIMKSRTPSMSSIPSVEEMKQSDKSSAKSTQSTATRTRTADFSSEECILLVKSWLNVSKNPVTGTDQKAPAFWERVTEQFQINQRLAAIHNPDLPSTKRTQKSLSTFWSASLNKAMNKFTGICSQNKPTSGENDPDKYYERMMKLYATQRPKDCPVKFDRFLAAFKILQKEPKWSASKTQLSDDDQAQKTKRKRPQGRDQAKLEDFAAKKAKGAIRVTSAALEERLMTMEDMVCRLSSTYQAIERDVVMSNAPDEMRREYFKVRAESILAGEKARKMASDSQQQRDVEEEEIDSCQDCNGAERRDGPKDYDDADDPQDVPVDAEQVHAAVTKLSESYTFKGPWTIPCLDLHPKDGCEDDLDALKSNISNCIMTTVVTSSYEDTRAVSQQLHLEHILPLPKMHQVIGSEDHKKCNVADYPKVPTNVIKLNDYAEVDVSNQAEVMAFNFLCDQITFEEEGGADNMWDGEGMVYHNELKNLV
ncbi:hypothetical protein ACHAWC_005174 [Mediolabrus comicus]